MASEKTRKTDSSKGWWFLLALVSIMMCLPDSVVGPEENKGL